MEYRARGLDARLLPAQRYILVISLMFLKKIDRFFLESRKGTWLSFAILLVGSLCGSLYISMAIETWLKHLSPPHYSGYSPFLLNTIDFVFFYSIRAISAVMLILATIMLFWRRRISSILSLVSSLGATLFTGFVLYVLAKEYGWRWVYNIPTLQIFDFIWSILIAIISYRFLASYKRA